MSEPDPFMIRAHVAEFEAILGGQVRASAELRAGRAVATHRYGDGPDEVLDLVAPPGAAGAPVRLFVHGGYWRAFSRSAAGWRDRLRCNISA